MNTFHSSFDNVPTTFDAEIWIWKHTKKILPVQISDVVLGPNKMSSAKAEDYFTHETESL